MDTVLCCAAYCYIVDMICITPDFDDPVMVVALE